jgi:uncharacterized protein YbjT (DUF2867 family)
MRAGRPPRALVTGASGFIGRRVVRTLLDDGADVTVADKQVFPDDVSRGDGAGYVPPKPGEMPAVIVDISAARALGYLPTHDLKSGLSTVWPEFSEAAK